MVKIEALSPVEVEINWKILLKTLLFFLLSLLLWAILLISAVNILIYYIKSIFTKGFLDSDTLKFAVYLAIGTYFCLILDKKKVYEVKKVGEQK